jgi:hypothetical protein
MVRVTAHINKKIAASIKAYYDKCAVSFFCQNNKRCIFDGRFAFNQKVFGTVQENYPKIHASISKIHPVLPTKLWKQEYVPTSVSELVIRFSTSNLGYNLKATGVKVQSHFFSFPLANCNQRFPSKF